MRLMKSFALVVLLASMSLPVGSARADSSNHGTVLFSIPTGGVIPYGGEGPEQLLWGPTGVAVDEEGDIWIGDGVGRRVVEFDRTGRVLSTIDLGDQFVGLGDIEIHRDSVVALDIAAVQPRIDVFDQNSAKRTGTFDVPEQGGLDKGLSGVAVLSDGTVVAELEGGSKLVTVGNIDSTEEDLAPVVLDSYLTVGGTVDIGLESQPATTNESHVSVSGIETDFTFPNLAGTVMLAGATKDAVYFSVDEVSQTDDGTVLVDTTVRSYTSDGAPVGITRVPRAEMVIQMFEPVAISSSGEAITVIPGISTIDVVSLPFTKALTSILPPLATIEDGPAQNATESCVSRTTMGNTDWAYRNNNRYYSATNISGACSGRTKPSYLGSAGAYLSVPYEWGGFDSVATFNAQMSPGMGKAGNTNSSNVLSCSLGVDCSGFVSRVWQTTTKYGTTTLPNISYAVNLSSMLDYDIFNKVGSHTMLYRYPSGGGYYVSDSATTSGYDRVVYRYITSAYASTFTFRRYNNVCS